MTETTDPGNDRDEFPQHEFQGDQPTGSHRLPPGKLMFSFLLVAGAYIVSIAVLFLSFVLLVRNFYPEVDALVRDQDSLHAVYQNNPEAIIPRPLFFIILAINATVAFVIGWLISALAPFAKMPHAFFLAVLVGVTWLQQLIESPDPARWTMLLMMIVLPGAILWGGRIASDRQA